MSRPARRPKIAILWGYPVMVTPLRAAGTGAALLLLLVTGCYRPAFEVCGVRCGSGASCPSDTSCGTDGFCHAGDGSGEMCQDAGPIPPPPGTPPVPRLVSNAYFGGSSGSEFASAGMSHAGFAVDATGIVDGELVLFIASVDNGSNTTWPNPIAPGFHQITQQFYGTDGQTFVVDWKIADHEPASYAGVYGQGIGSAAATISLLAVSGVDRLAPIDAMSATFQPGGGMTPVVGASDGVTTHVPHCTLLYASGADWLGEGGSNTFEPPAGFTLLAALGDHGNDHWQWTSQQVAFKSQDAAAATGPISGSLTGTFNATAWTVVLAIAPPPSP